MCVRTVAVLMRNHPGQMCFVFNHYYITWINQHDEMRFNSNQYIGNSSPTLPHPLSKFLRKLYVVYHIADHNCGLPLSAHRIYTSNHNHVKLLQNTRVISLCHISVRSSYIAYIVHIMLKIRFHNLYCRDVIEY